MAQPRTNTDQPDPPARSARPAAATFAGSGQAAPAKAPTKRPKQVGPRRTTTRPPSGPATTAEPDLEALKGDLIAAVRKHYPQADLSPIEQAFDLAVEAHEGQRRATGEPYVTHPIASAQIT